MGTMASQITSLAIVYSMGKVKHRSKKTSKLRVTGLCAWDPPVTGEFPAQRASYAENVSIWWHHHDMWKKVTILYWDETKFCFHIFQVRFGSILSSKVVLKETRSRSLHVRDLSKLSFHCNTVSNQDLRTSYNYDILSITVLSSLHSNSIITFVYR